MKRSLTIAALVALAAQLQGCADEQPAINRVGTNVVDKSLFTGSWYYSRVVIDVDYEAAGGLGTYPGDAASDFVQPGVFNTSMPRVRWVIDEGHLLAYRDYEILEGVNGEPVDDQFLGHPVAAFRVDSHFDLRRAYNAQTGEEQNVLVENANDRRWYERDYMRVDWSKNVLPGYYGQIADLYEVLGLYSREPADLFVQGQSEFPDAWQPQFDFMACTGLDDASEGCDPVERDLSEDYAEGEFYHFSFVTQELLSPGQLPNPFTGRMVNFCQSPYSDAPICTTIASYVRNAFLKVSETRQYEPINYVDSRFNRHGYFRNERRIVDRSRSADDPAFFDTDFANYNANRHNIWREWNDEAGNPIPYTERRVRPIVWYTSHEMPAHLMEPGFHLVSRWNEVYMRMVRLQRGQALPELPRISCQEEDPNAECFCLRDADTGDIVNPTCEGHYNPFETPEQAAARGVTNPFQCHVVVPEGAQPDMNRPDLSDEHFYGWYGAEMVGDECVVELRTNTCNRAAVAANNGTTEGMDCQQRGDLRVKFLSYVDQPGTPFLGVATLRGDPVTGETFVGDANIGGPALDGYRTSVLQMYDLIQGDLDDRTFLIGEHARRYLENLNRVQQAAPPREPYRTANIGGEMTASQLAMQNRFSEFAARAEGLAGAEGAGAVFSTERRAALVGTDIERRLLASNNAFVAADIERLPAGVSTNDLPEAILDRVSPFRRSAPEMLDEWNQRDRALGEANMLLPNAYVDNSVLEYVRAHQNWPRARLEIEVNQLLFYQTQLHEMGHCLGLRHSFGSSTDVNNYADDYYYIAERFPHPEQADFDTDGTNGLNAAEQQAYEAERSRIQRLRELAGIERSMNSSIMEYAGQWYADNQTVTGKYDRAAINFAYADLAEIAENTEGTAIQDMNPINTTRRWARFYNGGEVCNVDADCPFSTSGAQAGDLLPANMAAGITQRCVANPVTAGSMMCSNFDEDAAALIESEAPTATPAWAPVSYRFCTDDRVGTYAWCHRFDEGDSYREMVRNIQQDYQRNYIFRYFRNYRRNFSVSTPLSRLMGRQYNILQSVFANLLYNYQANPEYRNTTGAFGFEDHFLATADVLNFYGSVLAQPDIGAYRWDEGWERYEKANDNPDSTSAQLSLGLGLARYTGSEYEAGITGISRINRVGSFYDKWVTLQMMTQRGYVTSYTRDVPFWTNLYDLFPVEMQQIFQGMILNQPEAIAPRVTCGSGRFPNCEDPQLIYMDYYRGDCSDPATCRPGIEERYAGLNHVDTGVASTLQFLSTVFALQEFPVFFDTGFQNQVFVCIEGNASCRDVAPGEVEGVDYVRHYSERYGKTFIAWQVEPTENVPNQRSIGFEMVREAEELDFIYNALLDYNGERGGTPLDEANLTPEQLTRLADLGYTLPANDDEFTDERDRIFRRLNSRESYFFQLIQLLNQFGI